LSKLQKIALENYLSYCLKQNSNYIKSKIDYRKFIVYLMFMNIATK